MIIVDCYFISSFLNCWDCIFQIIFQLCLDDGHLGAIYHLHTVALADHAGGTGGLEHILFDQRNILDGAAQAGGAAVHVGQVVGTSQTFYDQGADRIIPCGGGAAGSGAAGVHVRTSVQLDFLGIVAARGLVVKLGDHKAENDVVQHKVHRTDHDHPHPVGLVVALPLPGTGAWMGALISALLHMDPKKTFPVIMLGVLTAGMIVSVLSFGILGNII